MYHISESMRVDAPHVVRMSFELPYLDWCRFQNSELLHSLTAYLEGLEKQGIPTEHQVHRKVRIKCRKKKLALIEAELAHNVSNLQSFVEEHRADIMTDIQNARSKRAFRHEVTKAARQMGQMLRDAEHH